MMKLPDLLKLATGVPSWIYLGGAAVVAAGGLFVWADLHGQSKQAARDAVPIAAAHTAAVVGTAQAGLAGTTLQDASDRASHEVAIHQSAQRFAAAVPPGENTPLAAGVDAAWRAGILGLRGTAPVPTPEPVPQVPR